MKAIILGLVLLALGSAGCSSRRPAMDTGVGGDTGATADTGGIEDSGFVDIAADRPGADAAEVTTTDSRVEVDSGARADVVEAGASDVAEVLDTGAPVDAGVICPPTGTGARCADTLECPGGFTCDLGRCIPQGRPTCGGFAGAPCRDATYTECLYETGHGDVGTCFSPEEQACLCAVAPTQWSCP